MIHKTGLGCYWEKISKMTEAAAVLDPVIPISISVVIGAGKVERAQKRAQLPHMAAFILKNVKSFDGWELAPRLDGQITRVVYRKREPGEGINLIELQLSSSKAARIPSLGACK